MMEDSDSMSERPHSAVVDMGEAFRGGSMGSIKQSALHSNPMVDPTTKKKKKRNSGVGNEIGQDRVNSGNSGTSGGSGGSKRAAKLSPADQRRIDEFKEGKPKPKKSGFMNSGKM
jgi:hypothetical protein